MDESIIKHLEPQVGTMKLSAAIRIGAMIRPQCSGAPFERGASCALGGAAEALGMPYDEDAMTAAVMKFVGKAVFGDGMALWRDVGPDDGILARAIWRKNDGRMTREQIADWLEQTHGL